jgi:predicted esterase
VCPSGPNAHGSGRDWGNNWAAARNVAMGAVNALRGKYGRRIQLYGNTLIGFSEGAFVAMNIGVREPRTFNRWLILAASDRYWGGAGVEELKSARARVRRVYLITGEQDGVVDDTRQVREWLRKYGVPTHITVPTGIGHELALEEKPELYRMALVWLQSGSTGRSKPKDSGPS